MSPAPSGAYVQDVRLDSRFAYWERQVFTEDFRQEILRRPINGSAPATQLERAGRLYIGDHADQLGSYAVSGDRLYYSRPAYVSVPRRSSPRWRVRPSSAEPLLLSMQSGSPSLVLHRFDFGRCLYWVCRYRAGAARCACLRGNTWRAPRAEKKGGDMYIGIGARIAIILLVIFVF